MEATCFGLRGALGCVPSLKPDASFSGLASNLHPCPSCAVLPYACHMVWPERQGCQALLFRRAALLWGVTRASSWS